MTTHQLLLKEAGLCIGAVQDSHVLPFVPALCMHLLHQACHSLCLSPLIGYFFHLQHTGLTVSRVQTAWAAVAMLHGRLSLYQMEVPGQPSCHSHSYLCSSLCIRFGLHAVAGGTCMEAFRTHCPSHRHRQQQQMPLNKSGMEDNKHCLWDGRQASISVDQCHISVNIRACMTC